MKTTNHTSSSNSRKFLTGLSRALRKSRSSAFVLSAAGVYLLAPHFAGSAATVTWNAGGGNPSDGSGTWASGTANWWDGSGSSVAWTNGNVAQFGAGTVGSTAYTVAVSGFVPTVGGIVFANNNYTLSSGTISLGTTGTTGIAVNTGSATIASILTGAAALGYSGTGTLTLSGSNSYSGGTWITGGVLRTGTSTAFGSGGITVSSGATLDLNGYSPAGTPTITISGSGTTGQGALVSNSGGTATNFKLALAADATIATGVRLDLNQTIAGNGHALTKIGTNSLDLWSTLTNTLSALNVQQGIVYFEGSTTSTATFNVANGATLGFYSGGTLASPRALTAPVVVAGGGILGNTGGGNSSTYDAFAGPVTVSGTVSLNPNGANLLITGSVSGAGGLNNINASGMTILSGSNSYSGGSLVSSGILEFATPNSMPASGTATGVSGGVLAVAIGGAGQFTTATSGAGSIGGMVSGIGGQGGTVTWVSGMVFGIDTTAGSGTYAGVISNPGVPLGLTKLGTNTLTLTGSSTYTGATTVSNGVLALGAGAAIGGTASALMVNGTSSQLSIGNGATVTTSASISVSGSGSIYLENGGLINTPTGTTVNLMGASNTSGTLTSSGAGIGGTLDLHGSSLYAIATNSGTDQFTFNNVVVQNVNDFEVGRGGGYPATRTVTLQNGAQMIAKSMTVSVDCSGDTLNVNSGATLNLSGSSLNMHGGGGNADIFNINGGNVVNVSTVSFSGNTRGWESIVISNSGQLSSTGNSDINTVSGTTTVTGTGSYWNMNAGTLAIGAALIAGTNTSQGNILNILSGGKVSTGGLILGSGSNSVTIDNGTLAAGANGSLISGTGNTYVRSGGAILDSAGFTTTVSSPIVSDSISLGGGLTKLGAGTLTLTATNTYTGVTTINAGVLELAKPAVLSATNAITANSGGTLAVNFGGASDFAAADVVALLGRTTFGATTGAFALDTSNGSGTYGNSLAMAGGFTKLGTNTLILTASSAYTGPTTISGGTLQISDGALPASSVVTNNAALVYTPVNNAGTCANPINGAGTLLLNGSNTLTLSGSNTFTGATTISSGTLILANTNALQGSIVTNSVSNGVVFNSGIGSFNFGGLSGSSNLALTDAGGSPVALNVGGNTGSTTYSGVLSGSGSLTQYGIGTLTLTGSNTFTGATTVSNGTLTVSGTVGSLAATSGVTVTGATLNLGDTTNGPANSINPAAAITLGGSNGGGNLVVARNSTTGLQASVASVTVGVGYNYVSANGFSGSIGALNITSAGVNYTRLPGGIYNSSGGGGQKSTAFVNTPTGSVIGSGANAMLIGAVATGAGYGFVSATSGAIAGLGTTNDSYASGVNTTLTADTTLASGTTQSLLFTSNVAKTLKLNGTFTVESGGIILGQGLTGVGNITGPGSLKAPSGQDLWIAVNQNAGPCNLSTISATIADDGASTGLTKFGSGTLLLSGSNTFNGPIYLDSGVLAVGNANALGQGTANLNFLGSGAYGSNVTLQASGVGFTSARNLVIGGGQTGAVIDTNGQNVTLSGLISTGGTPSTNSAGALVKLGVGTLTLNGSVVNTYNGSTAVNGGTLTLDFTNLATPTNLLNNSGSLILGGGNLSILGKSTGTTSQTLANLTLTANTGGGIVLNPNGGAGTTLTLSGSVTRNTGSTLAVDVSAGGTLATNLAAGTLGYATVKDATGTGFAKATGSALQRQTALTTLGVASSFATTDFTTNPTGSSSTGSPYLRMGASFAADTLTINTSSATGANFLDLGAATNVLTLTQKGLLMLGGTDFTIQDGQVGAAGTETIVHTMGAGTLTIAATVGSGAGTLTKSGTGTLVLAGTNTYTGATSINAGLVKAGVDSVSTTSGAFGTSNGGSVTVNLGAALDFNGHVVNKSLTLNGSGINGGGSLLNSASTAGSSTGNVALLGNATIVSAGSGGLTVGGAVNNNGYVLTVDGAGATTLSGIVSGLGSLVKNGAGYLTLSGVNTFSGGLTLNSGTLGITNSSALGNSGNIVTVNGGTVDVATNGGVSSTLGTLLLNNDFAITSSGGASGALTVAAAVTLGKTVNITANAAAGTTFSGVISDGGNGYGLTKSGTGAMTLTGANTYSGTTAINGGVLQITSDAQLGAVPASPSANIVLNGGQLENNNSAPSLSANRNITLGASGGFLESGSTFTVNGQISGSGGLGIAWDTGITVLSGSDSYAGATTIGTYGNHYYNNSAANPTLRLGNNNALPGGDLVFGTSGSANTATFDMRGFSATVGALTGGTNAIVDILASGNSVLTVGNNNASSTFTGSIKNTSGTIALIKSGSGTLVLNGGNTYTGTTTVSAGTLQIGDGTSGSISTSTAVTVSPGATLALNLANSGTFSSGIFNTGTVNLMNSGTLTMAGNLAGYANTAINQSGAGTTILMGNDSYFGNININGGSVQLNYQYAGLESTFNVGVSNALTFGVPALSIGGLAGSGNIALATATSGVVLTVGTNSYSTTYSGVLSGSGSLVKTGAGTLTLTGSNSYTGTTTINSGTLALAPGLVFGGTNGGGVITVAGGALSIPNGTVLTASANVSTNGVLLTGSGAIYLESGGRIDTVANLNGNGPAVNLMSGNNSSSLLTSSGTGIGGTLDLHNSNLYLVVTNNNYDQFTFNNVLVQNVSEFEIGRGFGARTVTFQNGAQMFAKSMTLSVDSSNDTLNVTSGAVLDLGGGTLYMHGGDTRGGDVLNISGGTVTNVGGVSFSNGTPYRLANTMVIANGGQLSSNQNSDINCVSGSATVTGTGSLWNMNGKTLTIGAAVITGTNTSQGNSLTISSGGTVATGGLSLGSTNNWVTVDGGTLAAGASGNLISGSGYAYVRAGGGVLDSSTFSATVAVPVVEDPTSTGGGLTKVGAGTLVLTASNSYTGGTVLSSGTLQIGNVNALGTGGLTLNGGVLNLNGTGISVPAFTGSAGASITNTVTSSGILTATVNGTSTYAGNVLNGAGSVAVVKSGSGTLIMTGSNSGTLIANSGSLQMGNGVAGLVASSGQITVNAGATLGVNLANGGTLGGTISNTGGTIELIGSSTNTLSGSLTGNSGVLNQDGAGTTVLAGSNSFSGPTNINTGVLQLSNQYAASQSTVTVNVNNGLAFGVNSTTIGALSGSGNIALVNGTSGVTLTAGGNNASTTYSGVLSGSGGLGKTGTGTLTLTASNSYTGTTTINNGTLALSAGAALGGTANGLLSITGGALSIPSGAVLTTSVLSMSGSGAIYLENGGLMNGYATSANGYTYLTVNGQTIWNTSGQLTSSGALGTGGTMDLHNSNFVVDGWNSNNYQFTINNVTVQNCSEFELARGGSGHVVTLQNGAVVNVKSATVAVDSSNDTLNVNSNSVLNLGGGNLGMRGGGGSNTTLSINGGTVTNVGVVSFSNGATNRAASSIVISNGGLLSSLQNSDINCVSGSASVTGAGSYWNMNGKTLSIGAAVITGTNTSQGNSLTIASGGTVSTGGLILGSTNNWVTFDGGTLTTSTNGNLISGAGYAYVRSGGAIVDTGTFSSTVAVPMVEDATSTGGGLAKVGAGTLSLTAANTFTGATTANGGTLKLANSQALQNSTLSVNAGVVVFDSSVGSHAFTVGALSGTGNLALQNNAGTPSAVALTAGGNNASTVYSGSLSGSGSLRKTGSGTLILGGSVGIAGLDANSGAVEVAQSASIGSLNVASGATVSVAANSDGNRSVLNISALTMAGFTPTLATANNATSVSATLLNAEALSAGALAGAGQTQNAGATTAQAAIEPASPEAVPEPGALGLLLTGAAGLLGFRRQGRRR